MGPGGGFVSGMEGGQSAIRRYRYGGDLVIGGGCTARGTRAPRSRASGRHPVWGAKNEKKSRGLDMALGGINPQTIVYLLLFTSMMRVHGSQLQRNYKAFMHGLCRVPR